MEKNIMAIYFRSLLFILLLGFSPTCFSTESEKADSLKNLLAFTVEPAKKIEFFNALYDLYIKTLPDSALHYAFEAKKLGGENNLQKELSKATIRIGLVYLKTGRSDKALEFFNEALQTNIENKYLYGERVAYYNLGNLYFQKGEYDKALENYLKDLKIEEVLNEKDELPYILNNIGNVYYYLKNYDKTLEYYQRALSSFTEINHKKGMASSYGNIANFYAQKNDHDASIAYHKKSIELYKEIDDEAGLTTSYNNLGEVLSKTGSYGEALEYYLKSLAIAERTNNKIITAFSLSNIGDIYYKTGNYIKSEEYYNRGLEIFTELGTNQYISGLYLNLAKLYNEMKQFNKSISYYQKYIGLQDTIYSEESTKQIAKMETRYETEKNMAEIELLKKDAEIQNLQLHKNRAWMLGLTASLALIFSLAGISYKGYRTKKRANKLLLSQNEEISHQKKEITDSINYAKKIQEAILPPESYVKTLLPNSFILYKPKDIVSGDFYWLEQYKDEGIVLFSAVDCTGHGVPGALMSVIGLNLLNQAVHEKKLLEPALILAHLDWGVNNTLRQSDQDSTVKDGMDLGLCAVNFKTRKVQYAGAYNPMYYIHKGEFFEIKADKSPIGVNVDGIVDDYTNHEIQLEKGDCIYLLSDGYADQFGGPKGKKFKYKALKELLVSIHKKEMAEQNTILDNTIEQWRNGLEQVDDILIIGVRI